MKKIVSFILVLVMVLSMAACGAAQKDPLIGTWKGSIDMSKMMGEMLEAEGMTLATPVEGLAFDIVFTFTEEGTVEATVDKESVKAMAVKLVDFMVNLMLDELKKQNLDLSALGMDEQTIRTMLEKKIDVEELVGSFEMENESGYYRYKDGKIYGGDTLEELEENIANDDDYIAIELKGNQFLLLDIVSEGEKMSDELPAALPITMTKQ